MQITISIASTQELYELRDLLALLPDRPSPKSLDDLGFTTFTRNMLMQLKIGTITELAATRPNDLLKHPNLGRKTLNEITEKMAAAGYSMQN